MILLPDVGGPDLDRVLDGRVIPQCPPRRPLGENPARDPSPLRAQAVSARLSVADVSFIVDILLGAGVPVRAMRTPASEGGRTGRIATLATCSLPNGTEKRIAEVTFR